MVLPVIGVAILFVGLTRSQPGALERDLMFYIKRNVDDREVHYVLNRTPEGAVNNARPFDIFWTSASGDESRSRLSLVQRGFVYGVKIEATTAERIEFRIAAYPDLPLFLQKYKGRYRVFAHINGIWCTLNRIHVELHDDNLINPNVAYVRLEGQDEAGRVHAQRIPR